LADQREPAPFFLLGGRQRRRWILRIACGIPFRGILGRRRIAFFGLFAVEVLFQRTNRPLQLNDLVVSGGDDLLVFFVALFPPGKSLRVRAGEAMTIRVEKLFRRGRCNAQYGRALKEYNEGKSTQIPAKTVLSVKGSRITRKIGVGGENFVRYERS